MSEAEAKNQAIELSKPDSFHTLSRLEKMAWTFGFLSGWAAGVKYGASKPKEEAGNELRSASDQVK